MMQKANDQRADTHNNAIGTVAIAISMAFVGFMWGGYLAPPVAGKIWLDQWQGLIGSLLGGGITIFAAVIAWTAVQRQISAQAAIQNSLRREYKSFLCDKMCEILELYSIIWELIEIYATPKNQNNKSKIHVTSAINFMRSNIIDETKRAYKLFEEIKHQLSPIDSNNFIELLSCFDRANSYMDKERIKHIRKLLFDNKYDSQEQAFFSGIVIQLSHLNKACQLFDEKTADIFKDRQKAPVDWRRMSSYYRTIYLERSGITP